MKLAFQLSTLTFWCRFFCRMSQRKRVKPIKFSFNERKAVQAAGRLVANAGGEINYLALMKLLYLIDREALIRFGKPITGDKVVAMKHGPARRSEEHTSELQSHRDIVCRLLLE